MQRRLLLAITFLCALAGANEPSKADVDEARKHFRTGEGLFRAGSFDRAIEEYQIAYKLVPRPGFLFNIGSAYRKKAEAQGGSVEDKKRALDFYQRYVDAEPAGKVIEDAKGFIAALREQIAAVDAQSPPTPAEPPVTPPAPTSPPPRPTVAAAEPASAPAESSRARGSGYRVAGLVTAGVGVALVGTGVYFGLKAHSIASDVDALKDHWDASLNASGEAANRNMYILLGSGAAAIAGGAVLYFVLGRKDETPVSVAASPTAGGAAVVMSGRF